ncbi:MAG: biotin/lipoyl-containing protein [Acidobacteriota bacterium]
MELHIEVNGRDRVVSVEAREGAYSVTLDGETHVVDVARVDAMTLSLISLSDGHHSVQAGLAETGAPGEWSVHLPAGVASVRLRSGAGHYGRGAGRVPAAAGSQRITAPMPGKVVKVLVKPGDEVKARQGVVVVEAMKMENELRAARDGRVTDVLVAEGTSVESGRLLAVIE